MTTRIDEILICLHCGHLDVHTKEERRNLPCRRLREKLSSAIKDYGDIPFVSVRGVTCLGFCQSREIVVFQGIGRETLVFGGIVEGKDEQALLECFCFYRLSPPRYRMRRSERPALLKDKLLARIPAIKKQGQDT